MSQQHTEQDVDFIDDVTDAEAREQAHRERGTAHPITVVGNPVLHRECKDVTEFDDELAALIDDMFASQRAAEGVGLAANQIGVDLKVFVYDCADDDDLRHVGAVCNPVLVELPADQRRLDDSNEGCLSVPGAYMELARPDYAVVRGQDAAGQPHHPCTAPATSPAASSTRPTTSTAASTSTASPSATARTCCARWPRPPRSSPRSPTTDRARAARRGPRRPQRARASAVDGLVLAYGDLGLRGRPAVGQHRSAARRPVRVRRPRLHR